MEGHDISTEEIEEIFSGPLPKTDAEISEAIQKWDAELKTNVLPDLDALIERDFGTEREAMWRELRARYAKEFSVAEVGYANVRVR